MKLVACPSCHTQYDITLVEAESVVCKCGEAISTETPAAVDAAVLRCGSCGAMVEGEAKSCGFCASEIVRDDERLSLLCPECFARNAEESRFCAVCGIGFQPEALPDEAVKLPCPVCTVLMPSRAIGGVGVNECPSCNGLWVPGGSFETLVKRAIAAREQRGDSIEPPRHTGGNPVSHGVVYRNCPVCDSHMQRRNFQRRSGVILDWCHNHGTWLDADELEQVAGFILSGGKMDATAAGLGGVIRGEMQAELRSSMPGSDEARAKAAFARLQFEHGSRPRYRTSEGGSLLRSAVSLIEGLFD
jgi:Zn-finger nucleic acid-binding protein